MGSRYAKKWTKAGKALPKGSFANLHREHIKTDETLLFNIGGTYKSLFKKKKVFGEKNLFSVFDH